MNSQPMPSTIVVARMMRVVWYASVSGPGSPSTGVSSSVQIPPTITNRKTRVWIRPFSVGSTSDPLSSGPLPPLRRRAQRAQRGAESQLLQVVGDLLGGDLQAEEGVHAGEVAAEGGGA